MSPAEPNLHYLVYSTQVNSSRVYNIWLSPLSNYSWAVHTARWRTAEYYAFCHIHPMNNPVESQQSMECF